MTAEGAAAVTRANRALASALVLVLVLAAVAPFAAFGVPQLVGADRSYVVLSGSMEPYMSAGDAVIVAAGPAASIREGDVITYQRGGGIPTTHRVIERVTDEQGVAFRTMGDANEDPDPGLVRPASVVGEVVLVIPYIGYVVQFANTPLGIVSLVVVPIGLLVLSEGWRYVASRRRRKAPTAPRPAVRRVAAAADEPRDATRDGTSRAPVRPRTTAATVPAPRPTGGATTTPAPRPTTTTPDTGGASGGESQAVYGVKTLDLGLTFGVLVVLAAYSGWMLYNEVRVESAMVLAGAVMALLLLAVTWLLAARAARPGRRERTERSPTTDRPGGASAPPLRPGPERGQETTDD